MNTARSLVLEAEARFDSAGLVFGHGTACARDEAVFLVFHALGLPFEVDDARLDAPLSPAAVGAVEALVYRRIEERIPAAYLTGRMWFAGEEFEVTQDVLVPRSPFAELILKRFAPWLAQAPTRALEIGTGSGCIAAALSLAFPECEVLATEISPEALELARRNLARLGLPETRVRPIKADLYPPADAGSFDLIVTNPPYVPDAEVDALPPEYHHEPVGGLKGGADGMDLVERILKGAARRLTPDGALVLEVGHYAEEFEARFPTLQFSWLPLENGGEGLLWIDREALAALG